MVESDLDLVVAGTKKGVLMVESEAVELSEDIMLEAVEFGKESYLDVLNLIISLAKETKIPIFITNVFKKNSLINVLKHKGSYSKIS